MQREYLANPAAAAAAAHSLGWWRPASCVQWELGSSFNTVPHYCFASSSSAAAALHARTLAGTNPWLTHHIASRCRFRPTGRGQRSLPGPGLILLDDEAKVWRPC